MTDAKIKRLSTKALHKAIRVLGDALDTLNGLDGNLTLYAQTEYINLAKKRDRLILESVRRETDKSTTTDGGNQWNEKA
jgi:hypothetical protein